MIEQASLVIGNGNWAVKSDNLLGYKLIDGKYYPRDMSVVRATTATRVNEDGLVELVPYNLLLNTNTFSSWNLEGGTLTSGFTAPDGSSTAYKYVPSSGGLWAGLDLPVMSSGTGATQSIWVKSVSGSNVTFNFGSGYSNQGVSNKTATSQWQLFTNSFAFSDGGSMYINIISDAQGIYVWHPQLVEGTQPLDYLPTTTRLNIPRIDYSTGSPALLVEPQRTNLVTQSQALASSPWYQYGGANSNNTAISPDGNQNANTLNGITGNPGGCYYNAGVVAGVVYTVSMYAKLGTATNICLIVNNTMAWNTIGGVSFTTSNGLIANEWARVEYTFTAPSNGSINIHIGKHFEAGVTPQSIGTFYIYGVQLEAGSYSTSYIPTTSASVTRNADIIPNIDINTIGITNEFTMFFDIKEVKIGVSDFNLTCTDSTNNFIWCFYGVTMVLDTSTGGVYPMSYVSGTNKIVVKYDGTNASVFLNGVKINEYIASSGFSDAKYLLLVGNYVNTLSYNSVVLFNENLTDAKCIELTTL